MNPASRPSLLADRLVTNEVIPMEHSVRLSEFPAHLQFPPDLRDKVRYDARARQLVFQGQMFKAQYDRLVALYDEVEYHRALQELFRISTEPVSSESSTIPWWLVAGISGAVAASVAVWRWLA